MVDHLYGIKVGFKGVFIGEDGATVALKFEKPSGAMKGE